MKRILAWIGILVLLGFAVGAFVFSFIDAPWAYAALRFCLVCAILVPVLLYAMMLAARVLKGRGADPGTGPNADPAQKTKTDSAEDDG